MKQLLFALRPRVNDSSLPSTHLPFTTVLCNLVDSYSDLSRQDDKDVSSLWKTIQKDSFGTLNDLSVL